MGTSAFFVFVSLCFLSISNGCEYQALINSLMSNNDNLHALSEAFYPPVNNNPEFVTVHYNFTDVGNNSEETWYWSAVTSHFIHPYEVFQYLSLFFAKPRVFYVGEVQINFTGTDPSVTECANDNHVMQLVTQRLKLFAKQQTSGIKFDDNYVAKAYNDEELEQLFKPQDITNITICTVFFTIVLTIAIIVGIIVFYICSKSANKNDWYKKTLEGKEATVYAMASMTPFVNIYILALTYRAARVWNTLSDELQNLHDTGSTLGPLIILGLFDTIFTVINIVSLFVYTILNCCDGSDEKKRIFILGLPILCSFISIIGHGTFIAIAYLNDGYHASSIFIYYCIVLFIAYGITWSGYRSCMDVNEDKAAQRNGIITILVIILIVFIGLVVTITCYFVIIPINKATSDAPNRLIGIFQSGGFVFGAFIVYRLLSAFDKPKTESNNNNN